MNNRILVKIFLLMLITTYSFSYNVNYLGNPQVKLFINNLVEKSNLDKNQLELLFSKVSLQQSSLNYYTKPKKKDFETKKFHGSWDNYEKKLLTKRRIDLGVEFIKRNEEVLKKVYKKYKVKPHYITAIIGIESFYGEFIGNYPVFDTLASLAFEKNRRNKFFKNELKEFLILSYKNNDNPKDIFGSFAGAIGLAQFMPSNFKSLAIDFNKDNKIDLNNEADAIASVANYLKKSGWNNNIPVATRVSYKGKRFTKYKTGFKYKYKRYKLKDIKPKNGSFYYKDKVHLIKLDRKKHDELWYGTKNFYVITRYNKSNYYAMAVHLLAREIRNSYK